MASRKRNSSYGFGFHIVVKIGDTLDILSLLFPEHKDYLVSYNIKGQDQEDDRCRRVGADDIRGKTILVYMLPLGDYDALPPEALSLIAAYEDTGYDFPLEAVFVPVFRGHEHDLEDRYRDLVSKIPWLAVPFCNEAACDRVQNAFYDQSLEHKPCWLLVDPDATVLLTSEHLCDFFHLNVFNFYGIGELVPLIHEILSLLLPKSRSGFTLINQDKLYDMLYFHDFYTTREGINNLKQLLASPSPDFLLTTDGTKVSFASLENKVVGLYLCNHTSSHLLRTELIKKTYKEAIRLGYNFEIVQIDFHSSPYFHGDPLYRCENIPWLTLPYMHSCCKRLVRLFSTIYGDQERELDEDRLVIINPRVFDMSEDFFEQDGANIICHFGIEAYPFTQHRLVDLENRRRKEEIKLQIIFGPHPLLRRRGESYDQVSVARLWGKWVMLIFATHSGYKSSKFVATLESKYLEQQMNDELEVVYISRDTDASTFDDCTAGMPWLVHPYSREFAHTWYQIFTLGEYGDCEYIGDNSDEEDWVEDIDKCSYVAFNVNGDFRSEMDVDFKDCPFSYCDGMRHHDVDIIEVLLGKYDFVDNENVYINWFSCNNQHC